MDQTRTKRMVDTALIATLALSGLATTIPVARGDEVTDLAITAGEDNNPYEPEYPSIDTPANGGVVVLSKTNDADPQDEIEEPEEPLVVYATSSVMVSDISQLKSALASPAVNEIVLSDDIQLVKDTLTIDRDVVLNLNKKILSFDDKGVLAVTAGNVEVRNGNMFTFTTEDASAAIVQTGGNLTLAGELDIHPYYVNGVVTKGDASLTIDDASISCNSERHAAINAQDNSKVTGEKVKLSINSNARAVSKSGNADVTVKLGTFHIDNANLIGPYLASGYKLVSYVSGLYDSRGDLSGSLASITLDPETCEYNGKGQTPKVTVTFDGKDVTKDCTVTYKDNTKPGTATATIRANATSDVVTGETTRQFEITQKVIDGSDADISLLNTSYTYSGSKHEPHVSVTVNGSFIPSSNYTVSYSNNVNAGTATATVTFNKDSGYTGTASTSFTINQKEATVQPNSKSKRAGESDPELTATVTGTVGSDKLSYRLSRNSGETAGTYTITASGDTNQGNYKVTFKTGTFTITGSSSTNSTNSTTSSTNSTRSNNTSNNNSSTSGSTTRSNSTSTPAASAASSTPAASTGGSRTNSSTATTSASTGGTTATAGPANTTKAASTTTTSTAKTPATADPSFVGIGALVSGALASIGIGLGARWRTKK